VIHQKYDGVIVLFAGINFDNFKKNSLTLVY